MRSSSKVIRVEILLLWTEDMCEGAGRRWGKVLQSEQIAYMSLIRVEADESPSWKLTQMSYQKRNYQSSKHIPSISCGRAAR